MPFPVSIFGDVESDEILGRERISVYGVLLVFPDVRHDVEDVEHHTFLRAHRSLSIQMTHKKKHKKA